LPFANGADAAGRAVAETVAGRADGAVVERVKGGAAPFRGAGAPVDDGNGRVALAVGREAEA
ncbi:MAG: hypothetical protein P4M09_22595, partial [Devosia sp.]|nr:hypothetical protein [Devosia sp.]